MTHGGDAARSRSHAGRNRSAADQACTGELVALLRLERRGAGLFRWSPDRETTGPAVFGGQLMGQALVAAADEMPALLHVCSLRTYFVRASDPAEPIDYEVRSTVHEPRRAVREVRARQAGRTRISAVVEFRTELVARESTPPPASAPPHTLPPLGDRLGDDGVIGLHARGHPFDIRYVNDPPWLTRGRPDGEKHNRVWLRAAQRLPDHALQHAAAFTYASDLTLMDSVVARHGLCWDLDPVHGATLDHVIWFHAHRRADEWFRYDTTSPTASGGRALGVGQIFAADGTLVATTTQEGLVRVQPR